MKEILEEFEKKRPELVIEWNDTETEARGWLVINSLKGGAAGGGTRMRVGIDVEEVTLLAKTMEIKFTVSGPGIGGAKSGIDFDPADPRKKEVLKRWYRAILPFLKRGYGTGGDLNVDFGSEVIPITGELGLRHPQEGIVVGHFGDGDINRQLGKLRQGTGKIVTDTAYTPDAGQPYTIADLISGYSVAESVLQYYAIFGGNHIGKRALVQGWGNVGASAGYYLAKAGVKIVGIMDKDGGVIQQDGFSPSDIKNVTWSQKRSKFEGLDMLSRKEMEEKFWKLPADIFLPCAASKLVRLDQVESMIAAGVSLIACGANVPFADEENFFGPIAEYADNRISVIPDFIANCGMARVFAYLMKDSATITDEHIFQDVSQRVHQAIRRACDDACQPTQITQMVLKDAINSSIRGN